MGNTQKRSKFKCLHCNGTGETDEVNIFAPHTNEPCPSCDGLGYLQSKLKAQSEVLPYNPLANETLGQKRQRITTLLGVHS